ncbi:MAG: methyltransferase domain-containing protein [Myxococcales bacterium]|nr:methyltransferase domain-containing protein [Myxococcales bacterium]
MDDERRARAEDAGGISPDEARAFYDRLGAWHDATRVFEDAGIAALLDASALSEAEDVIEFGCGTGRLAERLLRTRLPARARYRGVDVSETMVALTRARLAPWSDRAAVTRTGGAPTLPCADRSCDRVLATYVLDLLPAAAIDQLLDEAHRVLVRPGGRLCVANLGRGVGPVSRAIARAWAAIVSRAPARFGGCRPLALARRLARLRAGASSITPSSPRSACRSRSPSRRRATETAPAGALSRRTGPASHLAGGRGTLRRRRDGPAVLQDDDARAPAPARARARRAHPRPPRAEGSRAACSRRSRTPSRRAASSPPTWRFIAGSATSCSTTRSRAPRARPRRSRGSASSPTRPTRRCCCTARPRWCGSTSPLGWRARTPTRPPTRAPRGGFSALSGSRWSARGEARGRCSGAVSPTPTTPSTTSRCTTSSWSASPSTRPGSPSSPPARTPTSATSRAPTSSARSRRTSCWSASGRPTKASAPRPWPRSGSRGSAPARARCRPSSRPR